MGTRGMIGIKVGRKKIGVYNHFDSYPTGLGAEIVKFIQENFLDESTRNTFSANAKKLKKVSSGKPSKATFNYYSTVSEFPLGAERASKEWYALLRGFQFDNFLTGVLSGKLKHYEDSWDFLKDSLFCEYAYVLDMNTNTLECYKGFQHDPKDDRNYLPCKLVGSMPFDSVSLADLALMFGE